MLIGILVTGHALQRPDAPRRGYEEFFQDFLKNQGFAFQSWNVVDMEFPESVHECEGWLITGSKHGAYEDHAFIPPLQDFICRAYAKSIPLVGICFGHQIIAQALGGRVEKFSKGWSVGRQLYDFNGEKVALNAWHQDQVVEKPARAETVASSPFCEHAALLYDGKAFTVQAHPEFTADFVELLLNERAPGIVPDDLIATARADLDKETQNQRLADQIAAFFKEVSRG